MTQVSVLIPTYNRAHVLREALDSALAQTYSEIEIIVVDDGSTDNTREVITARSNASIRYLRHDTNRGYSAACNTGIKAANGGVIGFLDSDDQWKPRYLERLMGFLVDHPQVDAVFSDVEIVADSGVLPSLTSLMKAFPQLLAQKPCGEEYLFTSREMRLCLFEEVPIKPTALLARRQLYDKAGLFNEAWPSGTDWDLFLRFSQHTGFGYINVPLAVQKWSPDATHRKYWEQDKLFLLEVFLSEKRKLKGDLAALQSVNRGLCSHYSNLGYIYLKSSKHWRSSSVYFRGFSETYSLALLARAAGALLPLSWARRLRHSGTKARPKPKTDPGTANLDPPKSIGGSI